MQNSAKANPENNKETSAPSANQDFSLDELKQVWSEFSELRKMYKAEYQLLTQEIELQENNVLVHLHNPVQETLLNDLKTDITTFMREKLGNSCIQISGVLKSNDDKKVIYTNREKFEHLAEKNPYLKDLKDRLGLDPDF